MKRHRTGRDSEAIRLASEALGTAWRGLTDAQIPVGGKTRSMSAKVFVAQGGETMKFVGV